MLKMIKSAFLTDKEIERLCRKNPSCFCPPPHVVKYQVSNTPEYLRRYFMELGRREKNAR